MLNGGGVATLASSVIVGRGLPISSTVRVVRCAASPIGDPAYPRFANPLGPDGVSGTEDDDYRPLAGSPCIDSGAGVNAVQPDYFDVDQDGDVTEPTPLDLDGRPRFADDPLTLDMLPGPPAPRLDAGAYELVRPCVTPGDVTADGLVSIADLSTILRHFGVSSGAILGEGDLDGDHDVDTSDLAALLANFGVDCR